MEQHSLFPETIGSVSDDKIEGVLRHATAGSGRLSRGAELMLASVGARHLVEHLRLAGLQVVKPVQKSSRD